MRRLTGLLLLLAACWLASASAALAQDGRRVALVIGNAHYLSLPALADAGDDALAIADALRRLGFEVIAGVDLTRDETLDAFDRFVGRLGAAEIGLLYFAGHGAQVDGANYLLPVDAALERADDAAGEGLSLDGVLQALERPGLAGVVLIDAARGGIAGVQGREAVRGLAPVSPGLGQVVVYATQPGTVAADGEGLNPFTDALLRNITRPVDAVTMLQIVREAVAAATDGRQDPWVSAPFAYSIIGGAIGGITGNAVSEQPLIVPFPSLAPPARDVPDQAVVQAEPPPLLPEPEPEAPEEVAAPDAAADGGTSGAMPPETSPPAGAVEEPADVAVTRYPAMDLPERVLPDEPFPLMIWLSQVPVTPEVEVAPGPGTTVEGDGALTMLLPGDADWTFRVVLNAPGFRIGDGAGPVAEIAMAAGGDSTPALFLLTAEPGAHPEGTATIRATLWHGATFLASLQRTVLVGTEAMASGEAEAALVSHAGGISIDPGYRTADLTMRVDYADPAALGPGQVIIASPHFQTPLIVGEIDTPAATADWLAFQYESFIRARNQDRARGGEHTGEPLPPGETLTRPLMRGFGEELYRRFAPQVFKDALWALVDDPDVALETIQVYSNNPLLPWELMRPVSADGAEELDFLGVAFQVARWHGGDGPDMFDRPRQALAFDELVAIAPQYAAGEALASVEAELASLRALPGFREVPGRFGAVQSLFAQPLRGIVHFAGHGVVSDAPAPAGPRSYMIRLEDLDLNVTAWRGLSAGVADDGVFYFFNACDIGQAGYVANFVDGWAPAVLEAGAAGFIGGLWPVFDDSAAEFAARFYTEVASRMQSGPASVAAVLRELRAAFAETGDPTWLSYVYYGDVNLRLTRGGGAD